MNAVFAQNGTKRIYIKKAYFPDLPGDLFQLDAITQAEEVTFIDCYYKPYKSLPFSYGGGPHFLGMTPEMKAFAKDHGLIMQCSLKYKIAEARNFLWLTKKKIGSMLRRR